MTRNLTFDELLAVGIHAPWYPWESPVAVALLQLFKRRALEFEQQEGKS